MIRPTSSNHFLTAESLFRSSLVLFSVCHFCALGVSMDSIAAANFSSANAAVASKIVALRFSPGVRAVRNSSAAGHTNSATSDQWLSQVYRRPSNSASLRRQSSTDFAIYAPVKYFLAVLAGPGWPSGEPLMIVLARPPLPCCRLRISAMR